MNQTHHRLGEDLLFFAANAPLLIKSKEGQLVPWALNKAQRYTHDQAEAQRRRLGRVRALVLKARQVGESTYINGRGYHYVTRRNPGASAFVLSHEGDSTNKLFEMVRRYDEHTHPAVRPLRGKDNPRELTWPNLGADYSAATARNDQAGRSRTAQFLHGSEVAYWDYGYALADGALNIVSDQPGTEIWLESTADGPRGLFYDKCMAAMRGEGDYILIFIPWFWQAEYERDVPPGFLLSSEEQEFALAYFTVPFPYESAPPSHEQQLRKLAWRRAKILDLAEGGDKERGVAKFRQIYPSNPIEAFQATGVGLFRPDAILAARKSKITDTVGARVAGCDPAGDSDNSDRTVISIRQGRRIEERLRFNRMRPMELAGIIIKDVFEKRNVDKIFIDRGYGEGTIDRLIELGYGDRVIGVAFNERPLDPDRYLNKRSEMICLYADWLNAGDVRIPDEDDAHAALSCIPVDDTTSNGLRYIKPKREIKKALGGALLLDIVDADALTFAYPVRSEGVGAVRFRKAGSTAGGQRAGASPLKSSALRPRRPSC